MNAEGREALREAVARCLASVGADEDWPTNEALGGGLTGTRDDEYRAGMLDEADELFAGPLAALLDAADRADAEAARAEAAEAKVKRVEAAMWAIWNGRFGSDEERQDDEKLKATIRGGPRSYYGACIKARGLLERALAGPTEDGEGEHG